MRTKKFSCPNGCKLPSRKKVLKKTGKESYGYAYDDFPYCPICGGLMPYTRDKIKAFFDIYRIHPKLHAAERLLYKSEFDSAAREAFVVVESVLRDKSGLTGHGVDLVTKALNYEINKQTGEITKKPLISINGLETESERNEQDGVRFMLMGFFQGVRNLYQHHHIGSGGSNVLTVMIDASFFLNLLDGHSITDHGRWIKTMADYKEIYENMPKLKDRIKLVRQLKRQAKR